MTIRYLFNSGFAIESGKKVIIIDYYMDKAGERDISNGVVTREYINGFDDVLILASHSHSDHYNPVILTFLDKAEYVLSDDIAPLIKEGSNNICFIAEGESVDTKIATIKAYGSTDIGVSFHINFDGLDIFHAGDFNFWHWKEEATEAEVNSARLMFEEKLEVMEKEMSRPDIAFFPVDPRLGGECGMGAEEFSKRLKPRFLIPMHFSYAVIEAENAANVLAASGLEVWVPKRRGDYYEIERRK
ncbi:MAG: MBL fold metallo-hydrolase [Christensenellales bacterium]|jgi:L-ascorbate metabolism protein UlaG (beta-lactamase superfamily)